MGVSGRARTRPPERAARDLFERTRAGYFRIDSGIRRLAGIALLAVAITVAVVADLPVLSAVVGAVVMVVVVDLTLRSPAGVAVLVVVTAWLVICLPLSRLYPEPAHQEIGLALLALPVAMVSLQLNGYVPWRSAFWALASAGVLTAALADPASRLHVCPAWVGALLVLAYRWDRARRAVAAESYDSGWVEESDSTTPAGSYGESPKPTGSYGDSGKPAGPHGRDETAGPYGRDETAGPYGRDETAGPYGRDETAGPYGRDETAGPYGRDKTGRADEPARYDLGRFEESPSPKREPVKVPQARVEELPELSVDEALAELEDMIGLEPVKRQVRSIAASIEAAHLRAEAGVPIEKPLRHLVFAGPSGTGKTTVARTLAKIFYAFGLLPSAHVVEVHRADLVGEYLGATALKTNQVVDSALGGVLFIDEAYSLANGSDGQADRFGNEAVQALLKRAEDDRDNLVIILAGYEAEMESFLDSNPGLASRFGTRVLFPAYHPSELLEIFIRQTSARSDVLSADARIALIDCFEEVSRRGVIDQLGNGRFVRSLAEGASRARDLRVVSVSSNPSARELVTIRAVDVQAAYAELTARYRGYAETPTLEEALASLENMIGLAPVKRQVREITAQLQVRRLRAAQGLPAQPPMRHFVFTGPPGTGKTTVARVLGRIFAALGLLARPDVIEVSRVDLVGEHLGATAIKTNKVIDSALGGVLFIDEAYSLIGTGYSGGDAFGQEAVQTLLKRAEDDRERLVVILAGYPADMERLLASNPGLASRFDTKVLFPSYGPDELLQIAAALATENGDNWSDEALDDLALIFQRACGRAAIDTLGNGRFVRSLYEKACTSRDVRVSSLPTPTTADLTTLTPADLHTDAAP